MSEKKIGGNWSGKVIDSNGNQGLVNLQIDIEKKDADKNALEFEVYLRDTSPMSYKGDIDQKESDNHIKLQSNIVDKDDNVVKWSATFEKKKAEPFARSAIIGTYSLSGEKSSLPFSEGVAILWQFE
jgi:hypothetical protein